MSLYSPCPLWYIYSRIRGRNRVQYFALYIIDGKRRAATFSTFEEAKNHINLMVELYVTKE